MKLHTVLRPPKDIHVAAIQFAQTYFSDNHIGYCLGSDGHLPHITIIQTEVKNVLEARTLYDLISELDWDIETSLEFGNYYLRKDKSYQGIEISKSKFLQKLHDQAIEIHQKLNFPIFNDYGGAFWPHMTIAKSDKKIIFDEELQEPLKGQNSGWTLEFGRTGDHGVYLGKMNF